ncbi:MAG: transposase [Chloroflexi bacterium]|nr:transposase [Chloroflexota bacterium]
MFCQALAQAYPEAKKIRLVQDNLNTHNISAFYENLPADEAFALAQRFEFYFTPTSASWLNMIEIEFSALSRRCLNRRIPTFELLDTEISAFFQQREQQQVKIRWHGLGVGHYGGLSEGNGGIEWRLFDLEGCAGRGGPGLNQNHLPEEKDHTQQDQKFQDTFLLVGLWPNG